MGKKLVIVESPAKAKTIGKILGKEYVVKSSMGHIRDLPVSRLGVDVKNSFEPKYVVVKSRKKVASELKKAAKTCDSIYLCPDPDREGEAIAWHLKCLLENDKQPKEFLRVQYNEITPRAVKEAFANPGKLDMNRVDAQQARRVLDRIVGYMVSPVLWRRIRRGLSAGRVQSVALRLVCEREKLIKDFVPEAFWIMGAMVRKVVVPLDPFQVKLSKIDGEKAEVKSEEMSGKILADLEGRQLVVSKIKTRQVTRRASPPFITSTLQQAASTYCGYSPNRTMGIAQKLYEGMDFGSGPTGLITYMRTDSFNISQEALQDCRKYVEKSHGKEYLPEKPNFYKSRASAQEAHEAIRPTDVRRTPESLKGKLDGDQLKVYGLIWQRFVASQMAPAKINQRTALIDALPIENRTTRYTFTATASEIEFPGYMAVAGKGGNAQKKEGNDDAHVEALPPLMEGEKLVCLEWLSERKETQPPSRFSEASLVRELERNGVGRPSTYAATIATLHQRKYVAREKRTLSPTELGFQVNDLLLENLSELFDVNFTASMEDSLDSIEKGDVEWTGMLDGFYANFTKWMEATKGPAADVDALKRVLLQLDDVKEWAPEVTRGKRKFSDEKFVTSIRKQLEDGEKAITQRQLEAVVRIACRYRTQLDGLEPLLAELDLSAFLADPATKNPAETTLKKLQLLEAVEMDESADKFVSSLRSRAEGGRALTEAQLKALNSVIFTHAEKIEGFETLKDQLDLDSGPVKEDKEAERLLEVLSGVKEWQEPVKRGKRVFDDKKFYGSLSGQFKSKGYLSDRQKAAMKRMVSRYKDQFDNYERLVDELGLKKKAAAKKKDSGSEPENSEQ